MPRVPQTFPVGVLLRRLDVVVLQEQSTRPLRDYESFRAAAAALRAAAGAARVVTESARTCRCYST